MRTATEIVEALLDKLRAVQWLGQPAFDRVERYDAARIAEAFEDILLAKGNRVALVIWTGMRWDADPGLDKRRRRMDLVTLLISDRVLGDRRHAAMWGKPGVSPGTLALMEAVLPVMHGRLIAAPDPIDVAPQEVVPMTLRDEANSAAAVDRVAVTVDLECVGGYSEHPWYQAPPFGRKIGVSG